MTKVRSTKKALVMSIFSLLICVSMLLGTTFAWFSETISSATNVIKSGNLDIELEYWNGEKWVDVQGKSDILTNELWEPGATEVAYLRVANAGSLALKYQLGVNIVSEDAGVNKEGDLFKLSDYIMFGVAENIDVNATTNAPKAFENREVAIEAAGDAEKISAGYIKADAMEAGEELYLALVVYMPTTVGNEANHNGTDVPEINLGISMIATQVESEFDSFGDDYDSLAVAPDGSFTVTEFEKEVVGTENGSVTITNENRTFVVNAVAGTEGKVNVSVTPTTPTDAIAEITSNNGASVLSYEIAISGQAEGTQTEIQIFIGKSLMGVSVYQNGLNMDSSNYSYNPTTGFVSFSVPYTLARTLMPGASVYDITYDACDGIISSFEDISTVKGSDGAYVVGGDFNTSNIVFFGNGTTATLDLNGFTITADKKDQYAFGSQYGSVLHLTGNGTVNVGKGFMTSKENATIIIDGGTYNMTVTGTLNNIKHHALAQNDSKIIINGGTFTSNVENACLFFATSNARIEVNGGFFENTADDTPDLFSMGTNRSNTNRIIITGGTFVNWNPLEDRMCYTGEWPANGEAGFGGPWMLIPGGYTVISEIQENGDVWYTVVPVEQAE